MQRRIQSALGRGSLWTLATISFVAVYREAFETLLFFEAIAAQAGAAGRGAMWAGAGTGLLLLLVLAAVTFRFGLRLPMRQFFVASSALLYLFAIMLAGHGIAALQEAGVVPTSSVNFVRLEWFGIYPTREGLALQGLLIVAAVIAGVRALAIARAAPEPEKVTMPVSHS
ncbi:MAG: hypothetical protein E4H00_10400 [Myxococcales bacterium]|nr:MAG: hypothetical protein E4H00_10400 [Myxococcales bacterium]